MTVLVYVQQYDGRDFVFCLPHSEVPSNVIGIVGAQ